MVNISGVFFDLTREPPRSSQSRSSLLVEVDHMATAEDNSRYRYRYAKAGDVKRRGQIVDKQIIQGRFLRKRLTYSYIIIRVSRTVNKIVRILKTLCKSTNWRCEF